MSNFGQFEMDENRLSDLYDKIQNTNTNINSQIDNSKGTISKVDDVLNKGFDSNILGTTVRSENSGNYYYITDRGVAKKFPNTETLVATSGFNGCPTSVGTITDDPNEDTFRQKNPYVSMGDPMTYQEINGM
jgi:hypothetical protein